MQKMIRSIAGKMLVPASFSLVLMLSGCGGTIGDKDTDEAKKLEVSKAIDSGDYDKALELLADGCGGYSYEECQLNKGAAYFGKAGFDFITIGQELTEIDGTVSNETEKELQINELIFDKLFSDYMQLGITEYKVLLGGDSSICSSAYDILTQGQRDACLAIDPILLQAKLSDETVQEGTVDLEFVLDFKSVADSAIPGLTTSEFVDIVSGGDAIKGTAKDVNDNGTPDQLEITTCVVNALGGDMSDCTTSGIVFQDLNETNVAIGSFDFNVTRVTMTSTTAFPNKNAARLWVSQALGGTTVTLDDGNVTSDGTTACDNSAIAAAQGSCYPEPKLVDGSYTTFNDTAVSLINNDSLLTSIALLSDTSDTDAQTKVDNLKTDICGSATCTASQQDVLDYMSQDK